MSAWLDDYRRQLQGLLPQGAAWPRDVGATLTRLLEGLAAGLARLHGAAEDLAGESDPRAALQLLPDWERVVGLPDACSDALATTLGERRSAVVRKLTGRGGQRPEYYRDLAAAIGYEIAISEWRPFAAGISGLGPSTSPAIEGAMLGPAQLRHVWRVRVLGPRVVRFAVGESGLGVVPLTGFRRASDLECLLNRLKPSHTTLIFAYEGA